MLGFPFDPFARIPSQLAAAFVEVAWVTGVAVHTETRGEIATVARGEVEAEASATFGSEGSLRTMAFGVDQPSEYLDAFDLMA